MFWTRRKRVGVALAAMATVGAVTSGQLAFTASNDLPQTSSAGYGSTDVTGGEVSSIVYSTNGTGATIIGATLTVVGDVHGKTVKAGFGSDALTLCDIGNYAAGSTTVTCSGFSNTTHDEVVFHVLIIDQNSAAAGGVGGGGTGGSALCDDFDDTDGDINGRTPSCGVGLWTAQRGSWSIDSNMAKVTGNGGQWVTVPFGSTDATAQVAVLGINGTCGAGIALNANGNSSTLVARVTNAEEGNVELAKVSYDSTTGLPSTNVLASWTVPAATNQFLRVTRLNGTVFVELGSTLAGSYLLNPADQGQFPVGNWGLYSCFNSMHFDNFSIGTASAP
jgi:hypothetical protein